MIAVDDSAPDDGTKAAVTEFARGNRGHRVEYLRLEDNRGPGVARNAGVAIARGGLIAFLDPDDVWREDHLLLHLKARAKVQTPIVTASCVGVFHGDGEPQIESIQGFSSWPLRIFPLSLGLWNPTPPSAVVMARELFDQVGGFDEDRALRMADDWDLWLRLVDSGAGFHFINEPTVCYRKHPGAATKDREYMRQQAQNCVSKNAASMQLKLSVATGDLLRRVDGLESRLNWLQTNPLIRFLSLIRRLTGGRPDQ